MIRKLFSELQNPPFLNIGAGILILLLSGCPSVRESVYSNTSGDGVDPQEICSESSAPFGGGEGTLTRPYLICHLTHLQNLQTFLSSHFKLTKSLDLATASLSPIGADDMTGFSGVFDGNNKTLSNWTYQVTNAGDDLYSIGFFRKIASGGTVKNLILNSFAVTGNSNNTKVGVLAGILSGSVDAVIVQNATVSGYESVAGLVAEANGTASVLDSSVKNTQVQNPRLTCSNDASLGGLVGSWLSSGDLQSSTVENATLSFSPVGNNLSYAGGIAGRFWSGTMSNCSSSGTITGFRSVGGIAGDVTASIQDTTSGMTVTGDSSLGGAVGVLSGSLTRVSADGDVFGNVPGTHVGGIAGVSTNTATLSRVYYSGMVFGDEKIGGLVGYLSGSILTNSYVLGRVNGGSADVGGVIGLMDDSNSLVTLIYSDQTVISANGGVTPEAILGTNNGAPAPTLVYYVNRIPGISSANGGVSIPIASLGIQASYSGFDFNVVWKMPLVNPKGDLSPVLIWECGKGGVSCASLSL